MPRLFHYNRFLITGRNEVVAKVIFLQASVCPQGGCLVWGGVCSWWCLLPGGCLLLGWGGSGMHGYSGGGMHGCSWGACVVAQEGVCMVAPGGVCVVAPEGVCMVAPGGHVWLLQRGCAWLLLGGMCGCSGVVGGCSGGYEWLLLGGCAWDMIRYGDTINERAVRILLECILVTRKSPVKLTKGSF